MYIIFSLPFSRSTWLSCFLDDSTSPCYHDKSKDFSSFKDFEEFYSTQEGGIVDTALLPLFDKISGVKKVLLVNSFEKIDKSSIARGFNPKDLDIFKRVMKNLLKREDLFVVNSFQLSKEEVMQKLCDYINVPFNKDKFERYTEYQINTTVNADVLNREYSTMSWILG